MEQHKETLLEKYARLVVRVGVNLQKGQLLVINAPIACADFARAMSRAAFAAGARDVTMHWSDEISAHIRYAHGEKAIFEEYPDWLAAFYNDAAARGAAFVSIAARDPEVFRDIDPEKLTLANKAAGGALLEYRTRMMSNQNRWCVVSEPTAGWARKVFPDLPEKQAVEKLRAAIYRTIYVDEDTDPVANWQRHIDFLHRAAAFLNQQNFVRLHYRNALGTDLTLRLPKGYLFAGGSEVAADGVSFAANLPSEEVYSLPDREGTEGIVYASKPLIYNGNVIDKFWLRFAKGEVVAFHAERGETILRELLQTDEGSRYLGEVALVPYDSPISRSGILFYHTLFDENAACHLALGKAYPTCLEGGAAMDSLTLLQHGVNDSLVHEDFMVGTPDLSIVGTTADGRQIQIFEHGNWAESLGL
ncbi:MAG: aminopeptidase [Selenomonadaceae bacterium]|nr:aminopeptidase [Selenomonadaceae bacterium]MDY2684813.1 aminopeptidase [Selenomonadaceae bacterium]